MLRLDAECCLLHEIPSLSCFTLLFRARIVMPCDAVRLGTSDPTEPDGVFQFFDGSLRAAKYQLRPGEFNRASSGFVSSSGVLSSFVRGRPYPAG